MSGFFDIVFNVELALILDIVTSFILGSLLFLIKVPKTEYSRKIDITKNTIGVCFYICFILFVLCLRFSGMENYEVFSSMMMFVVTAISSAILSFSLINLLDESYFENDRFFLNVGFVALLSVLLIKSFWWEDGWLKIAVRVGTIVLFIFQCVSHIIAFRRIYKDAVDKLEQYYEEEQDQRLKWIRFCYIIMMLTQRFILVYMLLPRNFMKVYNVWYMLFMLYFAANFISFLGSHKLVLDAFAYKALSGQDALIHINRRRRGAKEGSDDEHAAVGNEAEFKRLERAIDKWVKQKKYAEFDKSRAEVAVELGTSKDMLHLYFTTRVGKDFKTWRTELRIEEAKRLLLENKGLSTNVVGEISGFSDRSNFHRQFVRLVGCTPKQWRESGGAGCA